MTTRKPLPPTCSKVDEIATLERFAKEAGDQTFLASLLSPDLIKWFSSQIRLDISCDIIKDYEYQTKQAQEAQAQVEGVKAELASVRKDYQGVIDALTLANVQAKVDTERYAKGIDQLRQRCEVAETRLAAAAIKLEKLAELATSAWLEDCYVKPDAIKELLRSNH
jgi:hypothetical protein